MSDRDKQEPKPGTYQHFKGGFYEVLGVAEDPETGKRFVVYQSLGIVENLLEKDSENEFASDAKIVKANNKGELAVCTIARFCEVVDGKEYRKGQKVPRFCLKSPQSRS